MNLEKAQRWRSINSICISNLFTVVAFFCWNYAIFNVMQCTHHIPYCNMIVVAVWIKWESRPRPLGSGPPADILFATNFLLLKCLGIPTPLCALKRDVCFYMFLRLFRGLLVCLLECFVWLLGKGSSVVSTLDVRTAESLPFMFE